MKSVRYIRIKKPRIFKNIKSRIFNSVKIDNFKYRNVRFFFYFFIIHYKVHARNNLFILFHNNRRG